MARASFNLVVANTVLMGLPRIDIPLMEFARVLTPGGGFVFSMTHPCFFCSDWVHALLQQCVTLLKQQPDFVMFDDRTDLHRRSPIAATVRGEALHAVRRHDPHVDPWD